MKIKFKETQKMIDSDVLGWINGVVRGDYNNVSAGELKRYRLFDKPIKKRRLVCSVRMMIWGVLM